MKIACVGIGSFVFGPTLLNQIILQHKISADLALVDPNRDAVDMMAAIARRLADHVNIKLNVTTHTSRDTALDGADFVTCCAAVQIHKRFEMDCEIIRRHSPNHLISEFGGIAGISYSLRQIAMIQQITDDMRKHCPNAWLLNVSNPLPRVCQAAHEEGIKTAGFCSVSLAANPIIWRFLYNEKLPYPWTKARENLHLSIAGLNHFTWVIDARDKNGIDLYPAMRERLADPTAILEPVVARFMKQTGCLLAIGQDHFKDFIEPQPEIPNATEPTHGDPNERNQRLDVLNKIATGELPPTRITDHEAWERPGDFIAAHFHNKEVPLHSLNLINNGQIPELPRSAFVETATTATATGPKAQTVNLPNSIVALCRHTTNVTNAIVQAGKKRSRRLVYAAADLDPTIVDKKSAREALDECLRTHADVMGSYH